MRDGRLWLNAIGIFAATSFVIFAFGLSPLWYSAALLAWIVRRQALYRPNPAKHDKAGEAADEGAGLLLAAPPAARHGHGTGPGADDS
ncbi:MAG TPA: hypothetical protein VE935_16395 [Burkholderiales bacterium]|nr:hypothetical protein [Burkholderiales bacterium]